MFVFSDCKCKLNTSCVTWSVRQFSTVAAQNPRWWSAGCAPFTHCLVGRLLVHALCPSQPPPPSCYRHCTAVWLAPSAQPLVAVSLATVTAGSSVFVRGHMMRTARWHLLTALHWRSWIWTVWCHHQSVTPDTHGAALSLSESFRVPNLATSIQCTVVLSAHSFYWEGMFITFANLYEILLSSTSKACFHLLFSLSHLTGRVPQVLLRQRVYIILVILT